MAWLVGNGAVFASEEFEPGSVPMKAEQVAPHSWYVLGQTGLVSTVNQGFNANAGFVVTADGVVVFDALGTPALGKRFADLIAATTPQPVRRVVVSHYHADHFYGLQALKRPGVEVWAHARRARLPRDRSAGARASPNGASRSHRGSTRRRGSSRPIAMSATTPCSSSAA